MSDGKTFTLHNGMAIPAVGFGTFASEGAKGETYRAVLCALRTGYRHFDCAWCYKNEDEVGDAIRDFLKEYPGIKREDIFVMTKVWNHLHRYDDALWSLDDSLRRLKLSYVDLFLIHWPIASEKETQEEPKIGPDGKYITLTHLTNDHEETWRALEKLHEVGKAKAIGVSNWTIPQLDKLLGYAKIMPQVNQIEIHPFLPNSDLVKYCFSKKVMPIAYSPLGSQNQVPSTGEKVAENVILNQIAVNKNCTLAQILIAWGIQRGYVVLPKSSNPQRIESNFQSVQLSDDEFNQINKVAEGRHCRFVNMKDTFGYDVWPEESM